MITEAMIIDVPPRVPPIIKAALLVLMILELSPSPLFRREGKLSYLAVQARCPLRSERH
jgi:hypothetical protein